MRRLERLLVKHHDRRMWEMVRMVNCIKLGRELPGLERPPFPGELGQRIFENVSADGYALWQPHMTILINHYALNPADPETRRMLRAEMEEFFFGANALVTDDLTPPDAAPSKGGESPAAAPSKGGESPAAAPSKGGAAPRRK